MKIHILSDLHLEFCDYTPHTSALGADVIVLAGDIGVGLYGLRFAARLLERTKAHVVYVAGNHEYYRQDIIQLKQAMRDFCSDPGAMNDDDRRQRLHFLDNDETVIDGVRFLGATLWTDFDLFGDDLREMCLLEGERCLNDFRLIRNGGNAFGTLDSVRLHRETVQWLHGRIGDKFDGSTIIVTHHASSFRSVVARYRKDLLSACFASKLDHLMHGGKARLWIHGHMHDSLDYEVNGTRVICNPRGYCRYEGGEENGEFNPGLIVEV